MKWFKKTPPLFAEPKNQEEAEVNVVWNEFLREQHRRDLMRRAETAVGKDNASAFIANGVAEVLADFNSAYPGENAVTLLGGDNAGQVHERVMGKMTQALDTIKRGVK